MDKKFCDRCRKEIKIKKCYEITFGKATEIQDGFWNAINSDAKLLCPKCYKDFEIMLYR